MGAAFSVPVGRVTGTGSDDLGAADFVSSVRELAPHVRVVALAGDATTRITDHPLPAAVLLVAGSERAGVSRAVRAVADDVVCIPQRPGVDSVNVGVAASIALHEWFRAHPHEEQQP
jgi:tRNA G18 (ribose-2'-O)-methylase SpoU